MSKDVYESPLASRYASKYMLHLFSPDMRFQTWRRLWVELARAEHELGLPITQAQVDELAAHITDIDYDAAAQREREVRHDVMAHVYAYGKAAPSAAGIIHLGATSCYVTDNADLILYRDALRYLRRRAAGGAREPRGLRTPLCTRLPALGYTHYQPAQPVTDRQARGALDAGFPAPTWRSWTSCWARCAFSAAAARPAPRRALWISSRATAGRSTR